MSLAEPSDRHRRIESSLRESFAPVHLEVVDESHLHAGHAGAKAGGGHFRIVLVSARFEGKIPIERQRLVYSALADEMGAEIHALSMKTLTEAEWKHRPASTLG